MSDPIEEIEESEVREDQQPETQQPETDPKYEEMRVLLLRIVSETKDAIDESKNVDDLKAIIANITQKLPDLNTSPSLETAHNEVTSNQEGGSGKRKKTKKSPKRKEKKRSSAHKRK